MVVTSDSAKAGEKEIRRAWPVTEGLTAGTTKTEGKIRNLVAVIDKVSSKDLVGIE